MKKAIFFDLDDTLYDHLVPFHKAIQHLVKDAACFPYEEAYHRLRYYSDILSLELGGAGAMAAEHVTAHMQMRRFQLTLGEYGIELNEEQARQVQEAYLACQFDIALFDGAQKLLESLRAGDHVVGIITNGAGAHQQQKIDALQLQRWIPEENLFISGQVGWDKPDERLFQFVNKVTDTLPTRCLFIGDSWRNDVVGSLDAGWTAVWFNHRNVQPESQHKPHYIASNYAHLESIIKKFVRESSDD